MTNENPEAPQPSPGPSAPPESSPRRSDHGEGHGSARGAATPAAEAASPSTATSHRRTRPVTPTALPTFLIALGVGLMAGGLAVAVTFSRDEGELDVPVYAVGLVLASLLLVLSAACSVWSVRTTPGGGHDVRNLAGWSGAVAALGLTVLLAVGLEDVDRLAYLLGGVLTGISVIGYAVSRHGAFVVTTIAGLGVLYAQAFGDVVADVFGEDHPVAVLAAGLAVFVVGVTVLGWLLPTRTLSAQVAGWVGVVGCSALLAAVVVVNLVSAFVDDAFGDMFGAPLGEDSPLGSPEDFATEQAPGGLEIPGLDRELPDLTYDVWLVLAVAAGLVVLWLLAGARAKHPGFTLLAVVMPVATVPLASIALAVERPTLWIAALAGPAVVVLGLATLLAVRRR